MFFKGLGPGQGSGSSSKRVTRGFSREKLQGGKGRAKSKRVRGGQGWGKKKRERALKHQGSGNQKPSSRPFCKKREGGGKSEKVRSEKGTITAASEINEKSAGRMQIEKPSKKGRTSPSFWPGGKYWERGGERLSLCASRPKQASGRCHPVKFNVGERP